MEIDLAPQAFLPAQAPRRNASQHHVVDRVYARLSETFEDEDARLAGWQVNDTKQWLIVSNKHTTLPSQGWKLHISAGLSSAEAVLNSVMPVLYTERVHFKTVASLEQLLRLNQGVAGLSQVGKFITVYPD